MKKFLAVLIAFAAITLTAQIPQRLNDSTFVYPCIASDSTTSLNFVGLPLETGWTMTSNLDPTGSNIDAISKWNSDGQYWETAGHHPALGWCTEFPVEIGGAYLLNAINNFDFIVTGDSVGVVYNLITSNGGGLNTIIIPLTEPDLHLTSDVGNDIYGCNYLSSWDNTTQSWNSTGGMPPFWSNDHLVYLTQPLFVNVTEGSSWPYNIKKKFSGNKYILSNKLKSSKGRGIPRVLYLHIQDIFGEEVSLDSTDIDFKAWISGRESEIMTDEIIGCGFADLNGHSSAYLNLKGEGIWTPWAAGETLIIQPMTHNPDSLTMSYVLDNSGSPIFLGFESIIPGSGQPLKLDMDWKPCTPVTTTVNTEGTVVTVSWEEYWKATGYNLYWSDDSYEGYEFVTNTTETSWQFSVVGSKKFYRVTAVY